MLLGDDDLEAESEVELVDTEFVRCFFSVVLSVREVVVVRVGRGDDSDDFLRISRNAFCAEDLSSAE
jgi:hypothetical protein